VQLLDANVEWTREDGDGLITEERLCPMLKWFDLILKVYDVSII